MIIVFNPKLDTSSVFQEAPSTDVLEVTVPEETVALAYLWRNSPLQVPHGAPIYADDEWGLPAAPFKFLVQ